MEETSDVEGSTDEQDSASLDGAVGNIVTVEDAVGNSATADECVDLGECSAFPGNNLILAKPDSDAQGDDIGDHSDTDNLPETLDNRSHRPFRDQPDQINAHLMRNLVRDRNADSMCSASTTTSVAPEVIKERVKKQFRSEEKIRQARRIRKRGEAAIQTRKRRENAHDVKTSLDAGWY